MTSTLQKPVKTINPLGTDGFEFVEYTAPDQAGIDALKSLFSLMGFAEIAKHKHKHVWLYRQGDTNFIVNGEPESQAQSFAEHHGASVNAMAFRVQDAVHAIAYAAKQGAKVVEPISVRWSLASRRYMALATRYSTLLIVTVIRVFTRLISTSILIGKRALKKPMQD